MRIGLDYQNIQDPYIAGMTCAKNALQNGNLHSPDIVLAFCSTDVDATRFYNGIRNIIKDEIPIIGGSATGIITNYGLTYKNSSAGIMLAETETIEKQIVASSQLDKGEKNAGIALARQLEQDIDENSVLFLFYDSIKEPAINTSPPIINASSQLIKGINEITKRSLPIIGAGLLGDHQFKQSFQFCGSSINQQSVVGVLLSGNIQLHYRIIHGCQPMDCIYHTITKMKGNIIYELDGQPVVELINELYGNQEWQKQKPVKRLSIGINKGDKYAEFEETNFLNRLIAGVLPDKQGIVMFEPDLEKNMEILFMLRCSEEIITSAQYNSTRLLQDVLQKGMKPLLGIYIDCAGRCADISETGVDEAEAVIESFNRHQIPLFGFYTGVEVAPFHGEARGLDWTGVLVVLSEERHDDQ